MDRDETENEYGVERTVIVPFSEADYQRLIAIAEREKVKPSDYIEDATLIRINNTNKKEMENGTVQN